jgi:phage tail sheath gpL-like
MYLYIGGDAIPFNVLAGDDAEAIADACVAAVTAATDAPVTAANTLGVVTLTSKTKGTYGNFIDVSFDLGDGQVSNVEITAVVVDMAGGSGDPDITDALNALGTGDNSNEEWYTEIVQGYGYDATLVQGVISAYNGVGNGFTGNYAKEVGRPFRTLSGDVVAGSGGLSAALAKAAAERELDRTNGIFSVPGSQSHPAEIAAMALGFMATINNLRAGQNYVNVALPGIWPGAKADRWTADYDSRNTATIGGVSPSLVKNGVVYMQDVVTFYHPAAVDIENNGWLSQRNISLTMNILNVKQTTYGAERYNGNSIVKDKNKVTNAVDRAKVIDRDTIVDQEIALATQFAENAWLYEADYTIERLNSDPLLVQLRGDARGFLVTPPYIYSGESAILDNETQFDVSIAVLG